MQPTTELLDQRIALLKDKCQALKDILDQSKDQSAEQRLQRIEYREYLMNTELEISKLESSKQYYTEHANQGLSHDEELAAKYLSERRWLIANARRALRDKKLPARVLEKIKVWLKLEEDGQHNTPARQAQAYQLINDLLMAG